MSTRCTAKSIRRCSWTTSVTLIGFMLGALVLAGCQAASAPAEGDDVASEKVAVQVDEVQDSAPKQSQSSQSVPESTSASSGDTAADVSPAEAPPAEAETENEAEGAAPRAKIVIENSVYDFGEVSPTSSVKGKFVFRNAGPGVLEVPSFKGCCGAVVTLDKKKLAPGEEAVLDVKYSFSYVGPMEKYIYLLTNDPDNPNVKLTIKGKVVRKLAWEPQRLRLFLDIDNAGCPDITVKSLDGKPFSIKSFNCSGKCISIAFDPNVEAKEFTLQPKVDIDVLEGMPRPQGILRIQHTHPGCDDISLNFDLLKRYSHRPARFIIFNADPAKTLSRNLHIQDNYTENKLKVSPSTAVSSPGFEIESVVCEKETAVLKETSPIPVGYALKFDISPPQPDGNRYFQDEVVIKIDGEEKEIRFSVDIYYAQSVLRQAAEQGSN